MLSSADSAVFVVGTLALFALATIGAVTVGVLAFLGASTIRNQLDKVETALIERERERMKPEEMGK